MKNLLSFCVGLFIAQWLVACSVAKPLPSDEWREVNALMHAASSSGEEYVH